MLDFVQASKRMVENKKDVQDSREPSIESLNLSSHQESKAKSKASPPHLPDLKYSHSF